MEMFFLDMGFFLVLIFLIVAFLASAIKILREYERGVVFTLGRYSSVKGPGLILIIPYVQQVVRVDLRVRVLDVPSQDVISKDNVSVRVNAVIYFRVIDPEKATIQVENFMQATSELSQTTLRSVLGKHELDEMLAERDKLNNDIQEILDTPDRCLGHQGRQCRDQARGHQRIDDPRHRPAGRGRARAARAGDQRRGRAAGGGEAAGGGGDPGRAARGDAATLPEHAGGDRGGAELHHRLPVPDRVHQVAEHDGGRREAQDRAAGEPLTYFVRISLPCRVMRRA
jgi:hypothetical protein